MTNKLQFDDQTIQQMTIAYRDGASPHAIGKSIGRNADTIRRVLRENGVTLRDRSDVGRGRSPANRREFTPAELDRIRELHARGRTLKQIGSEFGVSAPTIRKRLKDLGVSTARKPALTRAQRAQVLRRYKAGENVRPLAEAFGVSPPVIKKVIKDADLKPRSVSEAMKGKRAHNKKAFTKQEEARIRKLWVVERLTAKEIAATIPTATISTVHRLIRERGWKKASDKEIRDKAQKKQKAAFNGWLKSGGRKQLRERYLEGYKFAEIARYCGFPEHLVRETLERKGHKNTGASMSLDVRQALLREYGKRAGGRAPDLMKRYDTGSVGMVINFLRSREVDTSLEFTFSDADDQRMAALYAEGLGTHEIAYILTKERGEDIYHHVIGQRLRSLGVNLSGFTMKVLHESPCAGSVQLDGGWEKDVARLLDLRFERKEIQGWKNESQKIVYVFRGKRRTYVPDFEVELLDGTVELWEVKGKKWPGTRAKARAATERGFVYRLILEKDMPEIWAQVLPTWDWEWLS
jgi:uncharacterized protein YjcR